MLTALVLICSLAATPDLRDCTRDTAADVLRVPSQYASPATCFLHGQAYYAETGLSEDLTANERIKIVCARSEKVGANVRVLQAH